MRKVAISNLKHRPICVSKQLQTRSVGSFSLDTRGTYQVAFQSPKFSWFPRLYGNIFQKKSIHTQKQTNEQHSKKQQSEQKSGESQSELEFRELSNEEQETKQQQRDTELSTQDIKALRRRYFLYVNMPQIFQILLCLCLVWSIWRLIAVKTILEENNETLRKAKEQVEELQAQLADINNQLHTREQVQQDPASTKSKFL